MHRELFIECVVIALVIFVDNICWLDCIFGLTSRLPVRMRKYVVKQHFYAVVCMHFRVRGYGKRVCVCRGAFQRIR